MLCSLRLVPEGKTGKEIPESSKLEFLENSLVNSFALSDAEDNNFGILNREGVADLPLLRTLGNLVLKTKFLGSDRLLFY